MTRASSAFNKDELRKDLAKRQRAEARAKNKRATSKVLEVLARVGQDARVPACRVPSPRKSATDEANNLLMEAQKFCKTRKSGALWPGDAREDCRQKLRLAQVKATELRTKAAAKAQGALCACTHKRAEQAAKRAEEMVEALKEQSETQEEKRRYRERQTSRGKGRANATRKPRGEKLSEWRQATVANFDPAYRDFCASNMNRVLARAKNKRVDPKEACDELAQQDGIENADQFRAERNPFEGKRFDRVLAKQQAEHLARVAGAAREPKAGKSKRTKVVTYNDDVPF